MADYLMRDGAPFGDDVWEKIDDMVVTVVKKNLVGRRVVDLVGPLGWGVEQAPLYGFASDGGAAVAESGGYLSLQELSADFLLRAKHLATADQTPFGLDLGAVAIAATELARKEDSLIIGGLLESVPKGNHLPLGDWDTLGGPFKAVSGALAHLRSTGFDAPYALVMTPGTYARLASLMQHGRRELELVSRLVDDHLYQATGLEALEGKVLVLSSSGWNVDLVLGQDVATAYLGNEALDHAFRILETLALRVKRPGAACLLEA